jgi:chorismate mutase
MKREAHLATGPVQVIGRIETERKSMTAKIQTESGDVHPVRCRGIRGATTVTEDTRGAILEATREMLFIMIRANAIDPDDIASAYFTTTVDLRSTYPALAARQLGWYDAALLCGHEMQVPNGLARCIRVLVHWNTTKSSKEIVHVYLRGAKSLRPDRLSLPEIPWEEIEAAARNIDVNDLRFDPDGNPKREI